MADIKEIKVNDTGFSGYIAKFNTNCMSKGDITSITCIPSNEGDTGCTCEWVKFSIGTNTVDATITKNDTGNQRECVFEIKYKTSESTGCTKQFKIVQGSVTPEPPGPEPDPKPTTCVTPTDNCYWEENPNKSVPDTCISQWKTPNNHWWSGPIDDGTTNGDDRGLDTAGDISEGDTIRIAFTGNTGGQFVTTFTSSTFSAIVDSNCSSWLSFRITNDTIMPGGHGQINYKVTENTGECRQGFVKLYTDGSTTDHEWEGHPIGTPFCLGPSPVWVMQTGSGSGPTTCTLGVSGNSSSGLAPIPAEGTGDDFVKVGKYETDCEGDFGEPTALGEDFVTAWKFEDGFVKAKANKNTGEPRSTVYNVTKGDANDDFTISQDGTGTTECTCSNANLSITGKTIECVSNTRALVASYTSVCDLKTPDNYGHVTGDSIVNQTGPGQYQLEEGKIYMPVSENPSSGQRSEVYQFCGERFTITQLGKCTITFFQVNPTVMRDGVELGGTVDYHLNICDAGCDEEIEIKFHNNGKVNTIHHYPPFTSSYISDSFWIAPAEDLWAVGDAYFEVVVKGETKEYHFQIKPQ